MKDQLSWVVVLLASSSYCYSDTTYGVTNNAAAAGQSWNMGTVLPDSTPAYITVQINGLAYRYTMEKDPNSDALVHVRNEDAIDGGYVFSNTDDWSGKNGATIQKYFRFPYTDSTRWGDGEVVVEGDGQVSNIAVTYNYKMDVDEDLMKCATTPLADPTCRGYADALAEYLRNLDTDPDIDDPFYDEWVQASLEQEVEIKEEEIEESEDEEKEEDLETQMGGENSIDAMVDAGQQDMILAELAKVPTIEPYYQLQIKGGEYVDTLVLQDAEINDNRRALRNLANDTNHRSMVRSQYDRE